VILEYGDTGIRRYLNTSMLRLHVLVFAAVLIGQLLDAQSPPPPAIKRPVTDVYHGIKVVDDYRWLEDWSDPETRAWSETENAYARKYLNGIPLRTALHEQIRVLRTKPSANFGGLRIRGGMVFAIRDQPPKEQPFLVALESPDQPESGRVILDPLVVDPSGATAIDFYVPSRDGKYVAVSLSKGGSESGDVHVYETATGKALADVIPRVNGGTAGGSVAWNADGSGFYYTRYPRSGERSAADLSFYQQVWFHRLGGGADSDTYSLGKEFPRIAEISLTSSADGQYTLATMANGDGGEFAFYLLGPDRHWVQIANLADQVISGSFGDDGFLYLLSRQGAPKGKVLKASLRDPQIGRAKAIISESDISITRILSAGSRLYLAGVAGGPSEVRIYDKDGAPQGKLPIEENSAVYGMQKYRGESILFQSASYVHPAAWYRFDPSTREVSATHLRATAAADYSDIAVTREFATSKDGTKIPITILRKKGTVLDGKNPALLTAYGGYGISLSPYYDPTLRPLLDRGVVYAIANLRGGGEYGEEWHHAGSLVHKQNVFDDFEACARFLIEKGYTNPLRLAIQGGSNGGLLMGAAFTQHPELYCAVVSMVGIYDMLRVELSPNGAFNVTEFGTVKESDQFRALYAYSPYHHVRDGTQYPAILFTTGANDPRVDPMNSRKMTARLRASGTKKPVLLRTSGTSGHGIGMALGEWIDELADIYGFLLAQWGLQ
jgi:prolyl oligopeptidase